MVHVQPVRRRAVIRGVVRARLPGRRHRRGTGLVDMGARMYDPALGMFTANDPVAGSYSNPVSLLRYMYGDGDPMSNIDPDGRSPIAHNNARDDTREQQEVGQRRQAENGGIYPTPGPAPSPAPASRTEQAAARSVRERLQILMSFFAKYPGPHAYDPNHGFGRGMIDFTLWEAQSRRIGPRGSEWWNQVNGLIVQDVLEAKRRLARGQRPPRNEAVAAWMAYAEHPDGSRGGEHVQSVFWMAHQISLHKAIGASKELAAIEWTKSSMEFNVMASVVINVDAAALDNEASDTPFLGSMVNQAYPVGYPADTDSVGVLFAGWFNGSRYENVGLDSTRW